jgi:hypothetical protein
VSLEPSALAITTGWVPSMIATTEFVVPKSIPMILEAIFPPPQKSYLFPKVAASSSRDHSGCSLHTNNEPGLETKIMPNPEVAPAWLPNLTLKSIMGYCKS